jgi:hypothetical protein
MGVMGDFMGIMKPGKKKKKEEEAQLQGPTAPDINEDDDEKDSGLVKLIKDKFLSSKKKMNEVE